jgi:hypothetical protein
MMATRRTIRNQLARASLFFLPVSGYTWIEALDPAMATAYCAELLQETTQGVAAVGARAPLAEGLDYTPIRVQFPRTRSWCLVHWPSAPLGPGGAPRYALPPLIEELGQRGRRVGDLDALHRGVVVNRSWGWD